MILVDTQSVVWMTHEHSRLSPTAEAALAGARRQGTLAIADITLRELAMLVSRSRVTLPVPLNIYLDFVQSLFTVLPLTAAIAERSVRFLPTYPKDPADQLIGATAIVHNADLVTRDELIRNSGEVKCIW